MRLAQANESDNLDIGMGSKARAPRKYAIRAVVFQEGEWLCAQCLEYNLVAQAKSPFRDLPRAPAKYWTMFRQSRLALPAPMFKLGALRSHGVVIAPPQVRIAVPSAA